MAGASPSSTRSTRSYSWVSRSASRLLLYQSARAILPVVPSPRSRRDSSPNTSLFQRGSTHIMSPYTTRLPLHSFASSGNIDPSSRGITDPHFRIRHAFCPTGSQSLILTYESPCQHVFVSSASLFLLHHAGITRRRYVSGLPCLAWDHAVSESHPLACLSYANCAVSVDMDVRLRI